MPELVINVSNIVSPLCYTVLKLEPYTICPFRCVYCYSRWYMRFPTEHVYPRPKVLSMFREFVHKVYRRSLRPIPFRLSTLVDPFPPHEQLYRLSEKMLKLALEHSYPLIINTKSIYFLHQPLEEYLKRLLDSRLAVLQISVPVPSNIIAQRVEVRAPEPMKRLEAVAQLGSTDIPLVLRISPYIPYLSPTSPEDIESFASMARDIGFKHVIVETLRMEIDAIESFLKTLGISGVDIEGYSLKEVEGMKPLARVSLKIMENIYRILSSKLNKYGITFATCKEGLFNLHTASDCCGVYMIKDFIVRATLYDVYRHVVEHNIKSVQELYYSELIEVLCKKYNRLCPDQLDLYPKRVTKTLKHHEKKMLKILYRTDLLSHVAPHLAEKLTAS